MTIVPVEKIENDPQRLLYHFPSMHPVRYTKMSREYHFWKQVHIAESVAKMAGKRLVPGTCVHWERRKNFQDRRIVIQKKVFFVLGVEEMTPAEKKKLEQLAEEAIS